MCIYLFFFFKQKTAYEMRISDWSSDVCSSDLEDYLLDNADLLDRYVERTRALWGPAWSGDDGLADTLAGGLGEGLLQSLESLLPTAARGKRLLVRSPSIGHLEVLPRLFPGVRAVVVVRDPRAVADSAVRSFGRLHRSTRPRSEEHTSE